MATDAPIRILHLSDFHLREERRWDADLVLRRLTGAIGSLVAAGLAPDVVAFTGDIAFSGLEAQYNEAHRWINEKLRPVLGAGFPPEHLLFVPGNHDVDRRAVNTVARAAQSELLERRDQNAIADILSDPQQRAILLQRHAEYLKFVNRYRSENDRLDVPWWSTVLTLRGARIHFAGLCSSWMSWQEGDQGNLLVGRWQVNAGLQDTALAEFSVVLVHHPWGWLREFDQTEVAEAVHREVHLVLRGHLHRQESSVVEDPDHTHLELATGSVYDGSQYPNAFQLIEVQPTEKVVRVHYRLWHRGEWIPDRNAYQATPAGVATFHLERTRPLASETPRAVARLEGESRQAGALPGAVSRTLPAEYRYDAFISYRHAEPDREFVRGLLAALEAAGFRVAIDERDFAAQAAFLEEMERCIKESRFTLAVLSPQYLQSGNTTEEALICKVLDLRERRRRLIPLVIEQVERPIWLYNLVGVDFTQRDPLVPPLEKLKRALAPPLHPDNVVVPTPPSTRRTPPAPGDLVKVVQRYLTEVESRLGRFFLPNVQIEPTRLHQQVRVRPVRGKDARTRTDRPPVAQDYDEHQHQETSQSEAYPQAWEEIRDRLRRGIVLGNPGYGKSWLLGAEGRRIAREQRERLTAGAQPPEELLQHLVVPVFARLPELAEILPHTKDADLIEALWSLTKHDYQLPDSVKDWLTTRLKSETSVLLLDGLDEVPVAHEQRKTLVAELELLARTTRGRIILTSRITGYDRAPFPLAQTADEQEVELIEFDNAQIIGFIAAWFTADTVRSLALIQRLIGTPGLRPLARIPLLLTFFCLIAHDPEPFPIRRSELYEKVLRRLLRGEWRGRSDGDSEPGRIDFKLEVLEAVAWKMAEEHPGWQDHLTEGEAARTLGKVPHRAELGPTVPSVLGELSVKDGVLVRAGLPGLGQDWSEIQYRFLHRTLHEYLVARALARRDDWKAQVRAHCWFEPGWDEAIVLLAGRLATHSSPPARGVTPAALVQELLKVPHDAFHAMRLLAGRCIAEAEPSMVASTDVRQVIEHLLALVGSGSARDRWQALQVLRELRPSAVGGLLHALDDPDSVVQEDVAKALGWIGDRRALEPLSRLLAQQDAHVRRAAIEAMGQIAVVAGNGDVVKTVETLSQVASDTTESVFIRWTAAEVLERIALFVRWTAAEALERIAQRRVEPTQLAWLRSEVASEREAVDAVLGNSLDEATVPTLIRALSEGNEFERHSAAGTLGRHRVEQAIEPLVRILRDKREGAPIQRAAAEALGKIGDPWAVDDLLAALKHDAIYVVGAAAEALGHIIGAPHTADELVRVTADELARVLERHDVEFHVQRTVAEALVELGDARGVDWLVSAWATMPMDYDRLRAYEILYRLAQRVRQVVGNGWEELRARLMALTAYTLATGLGRRPVWRAQATQQYQCVLRALPGFSPALAKLRELAND
jgi:HEAT repeat protein/predicted MPP superfamily phosphohydrolase